MKKLICIMGKTFSGKTTLVNRLKKEGVLDFIISHTNRPIRNGEVNGRDYYFETETKPEALALRTYQPSKAVSGSTWSYWFDQGDIEQAAHPVIVIDYQGFLDIKKALPHVEVVALYLDVSLSTLLNRISNNIHNEAKLSEAVRRLSSDDVAFSNAIQNEFRQVTLNRVQLRTQKNGVILVDDHNVDHLTSTALLTI